MMHVFKFLKDKLPTASTDRSYNSSSPRIILSTRAYRDILNETSQHLQTETGGVFIGAQERGVWYVVESIDPGPRASLSHSYFEYDKGYVNHLANKVSKRYAFPLRLVGLWHRHPGSFDSFSSTDDQTHLRYLGQCGTAVISILANIDPKFRLTSYVIDGPPVRHHKVSHAIGDKFLPADILNPVDETALLKRIERPSSSRTASAHNLEIVSHGASDRPRASPLRQRGDAEKFEQTDSSDKVLSMLDSELDFLERQNDFSYQLEMVPAGLVLTMQRLSDDGEEKPLQFLFSVQNDKRLVTLERNSYRFQEGIIEKLIGERYY